MLHRERPVGESYYEALLRMTGGPICEECKETWPCKGALDERDQLMEQMVVALSTLLDHWEIENEDCRAMTQAAVDAYRQWKEQAGDRLESRPS